MGEEGTIKKNLKGRLVAVEWGGEQFLHLSVNNGKGGGLEGWLDKFAGMRK